VEEALAANVLAEYSVPAPAWEYLVRDLACAMPDIPLNRLGAEGWELAAVVHHTFYFKRPKPGGGA
jgi:hypothetical protein